MHRYKSLDPDVERELEELEAALNGYAGADAQLVALVDDVRSQAPSIDARFQATLQQKIEDGFPREASRAPSRLKLPRTRELLGAAGVAGVLAATVIVIAVVAGTDRPGSSGSQSSMAGSVALDSTASDTRDAQAMPEAAAPTGNLAAESADTPRKVERAARLSLKTSADDVQSVADGVVRETQAAGGYVADSNVSTSAAASNARFTLRVPATQLAGAIASLSKLASVSALSQESRDITSTYASASERLSATKAERKGLLRALANASSAGEIAALKQQISINRQEIAAANHEVRRLRRRSSMSTVAVEISGTGKREGATGWSIGDASNDALAVLVAIAGAAIIGLAVAVPGLAIAGVAWLLIAALNRRRREAVLDSQ